MNKYFVVNLLLMTLQGCNAFYVNQPPAPVYSRTRATYPVIDPAKDNSRHGAGIEKINKLQEQGQLLPVTVRATQAVINPLTDIKPMSQAIMSLVLEAEKRSQAGNLSSAVAIIERALLIESRNPRLTYKLAKLRLKQSKPRLAEDLAQKAALLSAQDISLKRQSWLLISEARKQQHNYYGAKQAQLKADNL